VAVVGASRDPAKVGHQVLRNLKASGFTGKLFPVNPRVREILGLIAYPSLEEISDRVDLAVVIVPAIAVPRVIDQCDGAGVSAAVIMSGGFREIGAEGEKIEQDLRDTLKRTKVRVIGPNCTGVDNPHIGLCMWLPLRKHGYISVVTQSGTVASAIKCWAENEGLGIAKCVTLGNRIDIDETDLLRYLGDDPLTRVIALYLESVSDGTRFLKAASDVSKRKPILALKGGRTQPGARAAVTHTRSIVGDDQIFQAAMKQCGVIRVQTTEELYDSSKALSYLTLPSGPNVLIVTSSGGSAILAADVCSDMGLELPPLTRSTEKTLRQKLPGYCIFSNPFDLTTTTADQFRVVVEENIHDPMIHAFLLIFGDPLLGASEVVDSFRPSTEKPIIVAYLGGGDVEDKERAIMHSRGIPVFPSPERAAQALGVLLVRSEYLREED